MKTYIYKEQKSLLAIILIMVQLCSAIPVFAAETAGVTSSFPTVAYTEEQKDKVISSGMMYYINRYGFDSSRTQLAGPYYGLYLINGEYYIPIESLNIFGVGVADRRYFGVSSYFMYNANHKSDNPVAYRIALTGEKKLQGAYTLEYTQPFITGKEVGVATVSDIVVYTTTSGTVKYNTLLQNGDYPCISLKDLNLLDVKGFKSNVVKYDEKLGAFLIGCSAVEMSTSVELRKEKDLLGEALASFIVPGMTDREKVEAINKYICTEFKYAYGDYAVDASYYDRTNIILATGQGKCEEFALLFKAFCERSAIPCFVMQSLAMDHSWNKVFVDGEWKYVDCTMNATASKGRTVWLLVDKATIRKDHYIFAKDSEFAPLEDQAWR